MSTVSPNLYPGTVTRYGYLNTASSAGRPVEYVVDPRTLNYITVWHNYYGNPSYGFIFDAGATVTVLATGEQVPARTLYLVDDFGALNDLHRIPLILEDRRRDLFAGWYR
jgi:hypothetical protein